LDPSKYFNVYDDIGCPLGLIRNKVAKRGAALDQISAMMNPPGAGEILSMSLWTPSTPTGRLYTGNYPQGRAQINLVIQDYHAMVAVPKSMCSQISAERYRIP